MSKNIGIKNTNNIFKNYERFHYRARCNRCRKRKMGQKPLGIGPEELNQDRLPPY